VIVCAVVDDALSPDFPLGDSLEVFIRREDAERSIAEVRGDEPELAAKLRIERSGYCRLASACDSSPNRRPIASTTSDDSSGMSCERSDGVNIILRIVALGAGAPWFYMGRRGMYANRLDRLARHARAKHLGLWGACPAYPL